MNRARPGVIAAAKGLALGSLMPAGLVLLAVLAAGPALVAWGVAFAITGHQGWPWADQPHRIPGGGFGTLVPGNLRQASQETRVIVLVVTVAAALVVLPLLVQATLLLVRKLANLTRVLAGEWTGVTIRDPYRPPKAGGGPYRRLAWLLADRATWRDLLWLAVNACFGWILALAPAVTVIGGLVSVFRIVTGQSGLLAWTPFPEQVLATAGLMALGLWTAPRLLRGYSFLARWLLAPHGNAELLRRVEHLSQTRTETIDTSAAEIRRIERDLHDGAQARLVAMGMTLDAASQVLDDNPDAARALLQEARDSSVKALAELRALVRGVHPPVLADRGLADAIRALALDSSLRIHLASDLDGRPPAPVESAAYFAVSELLANVSKHAEATQTWIDIRHSGGTLQLGVTDDGRGGASPAKGSGLRGIERRLASFDGVLDVSSPPGGPTAVTMEIPCALSSPKTSSS